MHGKKVLEASASEHWGTPDPVAIGIQSIWGLFDLDAAASKENAKAEEWFDEEDDGLKQDWYGVTFCNPPFNLKKKMRVDPWIAKARHETERTVGDLCRRAILLVPARTSNKWWHEHVMGVAAYVIFVGVHLMGVGEALKVMFVITAIAVVGLLAAIAFAPANRRCLTGGLLVALLVAAPVCLRIWPTLPTGHVSGESGQPCQPCQ